MINIDEIEEICDAMIEEGMDYCPPAGCGTAANVKELITRLRQAERDATRYRFMRDMSDDVDLSEFFYIDISERDDLIDEAMKCK